MIKFQKYSTLIKREESDNFIFSKKQTGYPLSASLDIIAEARNKNTLEYNGNYYQKRKKMKSKKRMNSALTQLQVKKRKRNK